MKIRGFSLSDYRRVVGVWASAGLEFRPGDPLEELKVKLRRDREFFLVAEEAGVVIGSVMGAWDGRRGWIYHLGVAPEVQRRGVASALIKELERRMRRKGVLKVNALIGTRNRASVAFFKSAGFEVIDTKEAEKTLAKEKGLTTRTGLKARVER